MQHWRLLEGSREHRWRRCLEMREKGVADNGFPSPSRMPQCSSLPWPQNNPFEARMCAKYTLSSACMMDRLLLRTVSSLLSPNPIFILCMYLTCWGQWLTPEHETCGAVSPMGAKTRLTRLGHATMGSGQCLFLGSCAELMMMLRCARVFLQVRRWCEWSSLTAGSAARALRIDNGDSSGCECELSLERASWELTWPPWKRSQVTLPLERVFPDPIDHENRQGRVERGLPPRQYRYRTRLPNAAAGSAGCPDPRYSSGGASDVVHLEKLHFHVVGWTVYECRHWSSWASFCICSTNVAQFRYQVDPCGNMQREHICEMYWICFKSPACR